MTKKYCSIMLVVMLMIPFILSIGCQKANEKAAEVKDKAVDIAGDAKDIASETAGVITEKAAEAKDKVVEMAGEVKDAATETAGVITEKALEVKDDTVEIAENAMEKASDTAGELTEKAAEKLKGSTTAITQMIKPAGREYVGAKKCKACHLKQYKSWEQTKMATSFENLKPGMKEEAKKKAGLDPGKDYTQDTNCVRCHTTGYGKGGYVSMDKTPNLANVQCESCHGPGGDYRVIMKKNKEFELADVRQAGLIIPSEDERGCLECHGSDSPFNEKIDPQYRFDFKERLKKTHKHFPLKYKH